jgi:hypothetical protein
MKYNKKIAVAGFLTLTAVVVGSGVAQAAVVDAPSGHNAVNQSSVSINGASYNVAPEQMIQRAMQAGATPAAALAQTIAQGYAPLEVLVSALRVGLDPATVAQAAHELGIDEATITKAFDATK